MMWLNAAQGRVWVLMAGIVLIFIESVVEPAEIRTCVCFLSVKWSWWTICQAVVCWYHVNQILFYVFYAEHISNSCKRLFQCRMTNRTADITFSHALADLYKSRSYHDLVLTVLTTFISDYQCLKNMLCSVLWSTHFTDHSTNWRP